MSKNESVKASLNFYKGLIYLIITGILLFVAFLRITIKQLR